MTAELVKKWLIARLFSGNLAIWTVLALEKVVLYCFWVPREMNLRFYSKTQWQMFLLVSGRHIGDHPDGHQHGVSIQSSVNLGNTLLRIAREWKIAETWFLARLFILQLSIISQILELIYWTITIFSFDHMMISHGEQSFLVCPFFLAGSWRNTRSPTSTFSPTIRCS